MFFKGIVVVFILSQGFGRLFAVVPGARWRPMSEISIVRGFHLVPRVRPAGCGRPWGKVETDAENE